MNRIATSILLLLLASGLPGFSQTAAPPADFPIGPADLLEIRVLGVADFSRDVLVSGSGTIGLPFLGEIKVEGLTTSQLEAKLAGLLSPNYVKDPQVSVMVKEPRSRMFSILGAVQKPGQYQMLQPITLVAAIAGAGGLTMGKAGDTATIQRRRRPGADTVRPATALVSTEAEQPAGIFQIEVDLRKLLQENELSRDIPIMPGDVINIPEGTPRVFYVVGDVAKPGAFEYPKERGIKLTRAMAVAGAPTKTSRLSKAALIRIRADDSVERIAVNLDKVLKGKASDIELQPNDMLYIPGSISRSMWQSTMGSVPYILLRLVIPY
jgi:polysaccharide export outer membrane protein